MRVCQPWPFPRKGNGQMGEREGEGAVTQQHLASPSTESQTHCAPASGFGQHQTVETECEKELGDERWSGLLAQTQQAGQNGSGQQTPCWPKRIQVNHSEVAKRSEKHESLERHSEVERFATFPQRSKKSCSRPNNRWSKLNRTASSIIWI